MENKKLAITLSTVFLIIALVIILIMGYVIYILSNTNSKLETELVQLQEKAKNMQTVLDNIQDSLNSSNLVLDNSVHNTSNNLSTENNNLSNTLKDSDKEQARNVAKFFVNAVNSQNWDEVEKYSNSRSCSTIKTI